MGQSSRVFGHTQKFEAYPWKFEGRGGGVCLPSRARAAENFVEDEASPASDFGELPPGGGSRCFSSQIICIYKTQDFSALRVVCAHSFSFFEHSASLLGKQSWAFMAYDPAGDPSFNWMQRRLDWKSEEIKSSASVRAQKVRGGKCPDSNDFIRCAGAPTL